MHSKCRPLWSNTNSYAYAIHCPKFYILGIFICWAVIFMMVTSLVNRIGCPKSYSGTTNLSTSVPHPLSPDLLHGTVRRSSCWPSGQLVWTKNQTKRPSTLNAKRTWEFGVKEINKKIQETLFINTLWPIPTCFWMNCHPLESAPNEHPRKKTTGPY